VRRFLAALTVTAATFAFAAAAPARAQAGADETCTLTLTRFDPDTVNVLFPDESAQYWSASYRAVPGTQIRIDGAYPYARYMSWNVYDPLLRPFDHFPDLEIAPDPGSSNPFLPGAARNTPEEERQYTLFIRFTPKPATPEPNTLYVDPQSNPAGVFTYRVYIPDAGRDVTGGVGLPQVTLQREGDDGEPAAASPCEDVQKPTTTTLTEAYASQSGVDPAAPYPGRNPPVWRKFVNLCTAGRDLFFDNAAGDQIPDDDRDECAQFGEGGFLSNLDNAYVYAPTSRGHGELLVIRGRAPTFADTRAGAPVMPTGVQLRFWSFCQNDPYSQRYVDCLADDQVKKDAGGWYTIVVSTPDAWPKAAQRRCPGVSWIAWGPQPQGVMIYRHMLPDPAFTQAIQNVAYGQEQQMGEYYPSARYAKNWKEAC